MDQVQFIEAEAHSEATPVRHVDQPTKIRVWQKNDDHTLLLRLIEQCVGESVYGQFSFDARKVLRAIEQQVNDPRRVVIVSEKAGLPTGVLAMAAEEHVFCLARGVTVALFYILPEARRGRAALLLMNAMRSWCRSQRADCVTLHVTTGQRKGSTHRLLTRYGFTLTGGNYFAKCT